MNKYISGEQPPLYGSCSGSAWEYPPNYTKGDFAMIGKLFTIIGTAIVTCATAVLCVLFIPGAKETVINWLGG